jgi:hypothetical protein
MKIRSISAREPEGRTVDIDSIEYHFLPDADGANVCDVQEKAHVARFLAIPEGYEIHDASLKNTVTPAPKVDVASTSSDPLAGTPVVEEVSDSDVEQSDKAPTGPDYNGMTRKQLEKAYAHKFGKPPNPRAKDETLLNLMMGD